MQRRNLRSVRQVMKLERGLHTIFQIAGFVDRRRRIAQQTHSQMRTPCRSADQRRRSRRSSPIQRSPARTGESGPTCKLALRPGAFPLKGISIAIAVVGESERRGSAAANVSYKCPGGSQEMVPDRCFRIPSRPPCNHAFSSDCRIRFRSSGPPSELHGLPFRLGLAIVRPSPVSLQATPIRLRFPLREWLAFPT